MGAINTYIAQQNGERPVVEALAAELRLSPQTVVQERQQLAIGYGQYAALRGVSVLGRASINRVVDDYRRGRSWADITQSGGSRINELMVWMDDVIRATNNRARNLRSNLR
jgi:hypothetical protein